MQRVGVNREKYPAFIVFVDGKSEKKYVDDIRGLYPGRNIHAVDGLHGSVSRCINYLRKNNKGPDNGDNLVMITDKDAGSPEDLLKLERECEDAGIKLLVSNPSFEVWLLAHYEVPTRRSQKELEERLGEKLDRKYRKAEGIGPRDETVRTAIANAERLLPEPTVECCASADPSTMVHVLVKRVVPR